MDSIFDNLGLTVKEGNFIIKTVIVASVIGLIVGIYSKKLFTASNK